MKIVVTLTDEEVSKLDKWIAPQVRECERRGLSLIQRLRYDAYIAYRVWKAIQDNEYIDEPSNPSTAEEHSSSD